MEPLSPTHPTAPTTTQPGQEQQKLINREASIVELPPPPPPPSAPQEQQQEGANPHTNGVETNVDPHDAPAAHKPGDRGASASISTDVEPSPAPAISTPKLATTSQHTSFDPVQQYSPTKTEIDSHPIRQRLSVHGEQIAASGWGTREEDEGIGTELGEERQEELQIDQGSESRDTAKMTEVKEGDKVAWNWGGGAPGGTASEVVTDGDAKMVSHRGNEVKKKGSPENPAVHIERSGNDVVKKASELEVQEEGPKHDEKQEKKDDAEEKKEETNGEAKTGEKRSADEANKDDAAAEKKDEKPKANGEAKEPPKKKGRPAKSGGAGGAAKKDTKKKEPKAAATADGKPDAPDATSLRGWSCSGWGEGGFNSAVRAAL